MRGSRPRHDRKTVPDGRGHRAAGQIVEPAQYGVGHRITPAPGFDGLFSVGLAVAKTGPPGRASPNRGGRAVAIVDNLRSGFKQGRVRCGACRWASALRGIGDGDARPPFDEPDIAVIDVPIVIAVAGNADGTSSRGCAANRGPTGSASTARPASAASMPRWAWAGRAGAGPRPRTATAPERPGRRAAGKRDTPWRRGSSRPGSAWKRYRRPQVSTKPVETPWTRHRSAGRAVISLTVDGFGASLLDIPRRENIHRDMVWKRISAAASPELLPRPPLVARRT